MIELIKEKPYIYDDTITEYKYVINNTFILSFRQYYDKQISQESVYIDFPSNNNKIHFKVNFMRLGNIHSDYYIPAYVTFTVTEFSLSTNNDNLDEESRRYINDIKAATEAVKEIMNIFNSEKHSIVQDGYTTKIVNRGKYLSYVEIIKLED